VSLAEHEREFREKTAWAAQGACREHVYYGPYFFPSSPSDPTIPYAKGICKRCPVQQECASYAWQEREPFGVWGGIDEWERHRALLLYDALTRPAEPVQIASVSVEITFKL
jgi:WhiB family transcriptional regulator, redox-sensing transcriptional regulator